MNTPSDEMLKEAARHIKRQNNYEKWQLLFPLSGQHDFKVDFQQILFTPDTSCDDSVEEEDERLLLLDCIFGTLLWDNYLYILCKNGILYMLDVENNSWEMRFPVERSSQVEQLLRRCQSSAAKVGHWLQKHEKE